MGQGVHILYKHGRPSRRHAKDADKDWTEIEA